MGFTCKGRTIECVELYPFEGMTGHVERFEVVMVDRTGRTVLVDRVERRDHQTLLQLLEEVARLIRHVASPSF